MYLGIRECGEIGRHDGLKIRCLVIGVRVQVPPFPVNYKLIKTLWTCISVLLALGINFYIPEISKNNKSIVINKTYYQRTGFPSQYFAGEVLTDEEGNYRIRLISISL